MSLPPIRKVYSVDMFLAEVQQRPPNVELALCLAVRRVRDRQAAAMFSVFIRASYLRDIGPPGDANRTLVIVQFDQWYGQIAADAVRAIDGPILMEAEGDYNRIKDAAAVLRLAVMPGHYTNRRDDQ